MSLNAAIKKVILYIKNNFIPILFALIAILLLGSFYLQYQSQKSNKLYNIAHQLKQDLDNLSKKFDLFCDETELLKRLTNQQYTNADLQRATQENYTFLIYNSEKLVFWNNNDVSLPIEKMRELTYDISWLKLPNGYFQAIKRSLILEFENNTSQSYTIVALQLIKNNFELQNKYIKNNTNPFLHLPPAVEITNKEEDIISTDESVPPQYYPISQKGTTFYLYYNPQYNYTPNTYNVYYSNNIVIILQTLALILITVLCTLTALRLCNRKYYIAAFTFLLLCFVVLRLITFYTPLPFGIHQLPIFEYFPPENLTPVTPSLPNVEEIQPENLPQPTFIQSLLQHNNPMAYSLGDMSVSLILITILGLFFYHKIPHYRIAALLIKDPNSTFQRLKAAFLIQITILSSGILIWWVLKLLLYNFNISFEIENSHYLGLKNMLALTCIVLLFLNFCLNIRKTAYISNYFQFKDTDFYYSFAIILLPFLVAIITQILPTQALFILLIFPILWVLKKYTDYQLHAPLDSRYLLLWILGFALLSSLIIHSYANLQKQKAKKAFAEELALEKDLITEFLFADAANRILEDNIVSNYYDIPLLPEYNIKERILQRYLSGYFDRYNIKIHCFNLDGDLTNENGENIQLTSYQSRINKRGYITKNSYLYLIDNPSTGGYNYLAKLPIFSSRPSAESTGGLVGYMIIEMESKANQKTNIYPELIIEDQFRQPAQVAEYSYATYKNGFALNQNGNYPYSTNLDSAFIFSTNKNKKQQYITKNGYAHFVFQPNENKVIIVSSPNNILSSFLSIFSQIFFLVLSAVFVAIIIVNITNVNTIQELKINFLLYASLRQRINTIIIVLLFGSFLIIGVTTLAYFYQRSTNKHTEALVVKQNEVLVALSNTLRKNWESKADTLNAMDNPNFLAHTARTLSEIHAMDINLYTANGQMIASSQPVIFEKQIMSNLMNPNAYFQMKINGLGQFLQNENIGTLTYLAAYKPIKNERAEVIGFLNLPYFATEKDLRTELSGFMITLTNVYVLLMLLAVSIAITMANSITQPLQMISQKLSEFRLGQKNERLTWQYNDEVGLLVEQYNNTIGELEKSVKMLAQSERQSAWQEMARQVAHEIKNPLTPMKLSIQHLQRAVRDNAPNLKERTERVSLTLIEQIDTLAGIASSFSEFARMPKSIDEIFDIKDVISNVANLYAPSENNNVILHKHIPANQNYFVFADKNQMLRVFNNLVKNAIQAIPETREGIINIKIDLNTSHTPTMVQISVQDNGCGISEEQLEKIFVPNFTTKNSGTGLGLSISKAIVEMAKGSIWFETTENKGTTFFVELPLVSQ